MKVITTQELERIEYYLARLQAMYELKLDDTRIPTLNNGLVRIYDERVEELKSLRSKLNNERGK